MSTTKAHITRIGTVLVPVSDQDRALRFYTKTLGFETRIDGEFGDGGRWIEVPPPGAETTIALVDSQANEVSFATDDADAAHGELRARGVDTDAEVLRLGEGVPACSRSEMGTGTATESSSETEIGKGKPPP
jgi:catechol 2,3-dioxygenase-like lactoylglutathione lyase family enzyme